MEELENNYILPELEQIGLEGLGLPVFPEEDNFNANLAEDFPEAARNKLASHILDSLKEDRAARKDWLEAAEKVKKFTGINIEEIKKGDGYKKSSVNFCGTYDTTLLSAIIRFYSVNRAELLPPNGPAGYKVEGPTNELLNDLGEKIRDWINYYLTIVDSPYYQDYERFLIYLPLYGCIFKKVYYDKILGRPISRFIMPQDFLVNAECTSVMDSTRLNHTLHLSKREILLNIQNGYFIDVELSYLKSPENLAKDDSKIFYKGTDSLDPSVYTSASLFDFEETHEYLNLNDFRDDITDDENAIPLPYRIITDVTTKQVVGIYRNWKKDDPERSRINCFVQYNYLPGFGVYGLGMAHLVGTNAITATKLLQQLVDAGTLKNFPGGIRVKGFKEQDIAEVVVGPAQYVSMDTGGAPLQESIMPLPYAEPSNVLRELRLEIIDQIKDATSMNDLGMLNSKEDIPAATIFAVLEENNRTQSAVSKSLHYSFTQELQLLNDLFAETLESERFYFGEQEQQISNEDFIDEVKIIPISDPNVNSSFQKIVQAEYILKTAMQAPELHNMRAIYMRVYKALGIGEKEIDVLMRPEPQEQEVLPLDPVSENINFKTGKPVTAAAWQYHDGHILAHGIFAEENPDLKPEILDHINVHEAYKYLQQMQELLGFQLPPLEEITDPQVQNKIAYELASKLGSVESSNQAAAPPDPNTIMMAEIKQREEEIAVRERIETAKIEADIYKAQLESDTEKAKIESNEAIAKLKSETELIKQESRNV